MKERLRQLTEAASRGGVSVCVTSAAGTPSTLSQQEVEELLRRAVGGPRKPLTPAEEVMAKALRDDLEARTTPFGLLRFAHEYRSAAVLVRSGRHDGHHSPPAAMLLGHALELALKAFLRSRGFTLSALQELGHNLGAILDEAQRLKLHRLFKLSDDFSGVIRDYGEAHASGDFRYIRNGTITLPSWDITALIVLELNQSLREHCLRATFGRTKAREIMANRGDRF